MLTNYNKISDSNNKLSVNIKSINVIYIYIWEIRSSIENMSKIEHLT